MNIDWGKTIDIIEDATGKSICKELNIRPAYISDLRAGRSKNPSSEFLLNLIHIFNVSPEWLLNGTGDIFQTKQSKAKEIVIQQISIKTKTSGENNILFLWTSIPKEEDIESSCEKLQKTLNVFAENNTMVKGLFIPYFEKEISGDFNKSMYAAKLTAICKANNIELNTFKVSDDMIKNTDSISAIKACLMLNIFPTIQVLKPSHLFLALPESTNSVISNINHALLGMFTLDQYFARTFPKNSVTLYQIEEKFEW